MLIDKQIVKNADFALDWQYFLAKVDNDVLKNLTGVVQQYVNGKHLACPMPLLKLKMALKNIDVGNHVYITATDPNSQTDINAFCRHADLGFFVVKMDENGEVFHILVQKKP